MFKRHRWTFIAVVLWFVSGLGFDTARACVILGSFYIEDNTYATNDPYDPSVGLARDGDLIVGWESIASGGTAADGARHQQTVLVCFLEIFADGFESCNTGAWSNTVGGSGSCNMPPVVAISSPDNPSSFPEGTPILFEGSAMDAEDGDLTAGLMWSSDLDGPLGMGGSISVILSVGMHTVTAKVTDSGNLMGSDSITVTVTPTPPDVTISSPDNPSSFPEGTSILFTGSAMDAEDGDLSANLSWISSIDGPLGTGASFFAVLSVGTHTVTASVTDSGGLSGSDSITVIVTSCDAPGVTINFDDDFLDPGDVVTTQYPEAAFSSDPGADIRVVEVDLGTSQPHIICTDNGTEACINAVFIDFIDPVRCLSFMGVGIKAGGTADVRVFHASGVTIVLIEGQGNGTEPIEIDLTAFNGVSRIEIVNVNDLAGMGWDDFIFDIP